MALTANSMNIVFGYYSIACFDIGKLIKVGKAPKDCEKNLYSHPFMRLCYMASHN